jgi:Peptidase propeptide and YPEB domain
MKKQILSIACICLVTLAIGAQINAQSPAPKKSKIPATLKSQAKISLEEARATALKRVPGTIKEEELEKENGKLVYSFDIQASGQKDITEVQVSALDGSIVSVEKEDAASEANEKKAEAAKKAKPAAPPQQ